MKTCVIIPTYNERENIVPLIDELLHVLPGESRIFIVDDASPDGTGGAVAEYGARDPRVLLMRRDRKLGLGTAYQVAFRKVLAEGRDECIVTMDADFSHSPAYVPRLIEECARYDLVIGSRYIPGGEIKNWEVWRRLLSWGGNLYVRVVTGSPIRDNTAGFSAMRTDFLRRVPYEHIQASGYAWWFALRRMFYTRGARILEIPITFTQRKIGESKISNDIIWEGIIEPWRIRFLKL